MIHMALCSALAFMLVKVLKVVDGVNMTKEVYIQKIVPVAFLFSIVLWLGNSAYLYLSVAFIQMVKASMPCVVYLVGVSFQIETFKVNTMANMVVITVGVAIASYGELNFHAFGFTLLIASILAEAIRLVSIQRLLAASDIKLNSVTTLYYVSPACFVFLTVPFVFLELPAMLVADDMTYNPLVLSSSAILAFALNVSVYLLIREGGALTMNVAGVVKDWLLICVSSILFHAPISSMQLLGYSLAFVAVCYYNYQKHLVKLGENNKYTRYDSRKYQRYMARGFVTSLVWLLLGAILISPHHFVTDFTVGLLSTDNLDEESVLRVCAVTAILGNYESTLKQPAMPQTYKTWRMFAFTDRRDLHAGEWTVINTAATPLHSNATCAEAKSAINSPCANTSPMILAKYFKTQFHKIEIVQKSCDVVVWVDATVEITSHKFFETLAHLTQRGKNVLVFQHVRRGMLSAEVQASLGIGRYDTTFAYGAPQSFQNISRQYEHYLEEGFVEKWFMDNDNVKNITGEEYGLWVTAFVCFDIRLAESKTFLDTWWHENLWHSSQDQVSFPYVVWKVNLLPHNLPDGEITGNYAHNSLFTKRAHGQ